MKPVAADVPEVDRNTKHDIFQEAAYAPAEFLYDVFFLFGDVLFFVRLFGADHLSLPAPVQ